MCLFCKIIEGEIPAYKIYEDDLFVAFLDISQATYGHTLVVPKRHIESVFDLSGAELDSYMKVIKKVIDILKNKLNFSSLNILNNSGDLAGQTVKHLHFHLLPRYENDHLKLSNEVNSGIKVEEVYDKIRK